MQLPQGNRFTMLKLLVAIMIACATGGVSANAQALTQQVTSPVPASSPIPPQVIVQSQPDSPLQIKSVQTRWVTPTRDGIELTIVVQNTSDKSITAYATRDDNEGKYPCLLFGAFSPGKALRPQQTDGKSTFRGYSAEAAPQLKRSVDFVEFTDGSRWGADLCNSGQQLSGQRAGAKEAVSQMLKVLAESGPTEVLTIARKGMRGVVAPADQPVPWKEGFRVGVSTIARRILQAEEQWGPAEIEATLKRPYDALETK
jgi:hypothetical protein